MKKRVRIYKAGGQSDAVSQEDIYKYIADTMSAEDYDGDTDAISEKLAQAGIDSNTADAYIDEVDTYLKENNPEEEQGEQEEQKQHEEQEKQGEPEEPSLSAFTRVIDELTWFKHFFGHTLEQPEEKKNTSGAM